jgi:holo-[acyl-carrier protein] synthase
MILGIGTDIADVRRIAKVLERHGDRFIDRVFTPVERAKAERRRNRAETYAKRFAAK